MKCPGCKRETVATDYCEWCFNPVMTSQAVVGAPAGLGLDMAAVHAMPLAAAAPSWQPVAAGPLGGGVADALPPANWQAPIATAPAAAAPTVRVSLTGEVIEEAPPPMMPPSVPGAPMPGGPVPPGAPIPPVGSAYSRPGMPPVGVPTSAIHPRFAEAMIDSIDYGAAWEKILAISFPLIAISMLIIKFVPTSFMWVAFGAFFLVGLATGSSRAIETYEDAFLDVAAALFAIFFLGPFGGLLAYAIVGAIKREWNAALLAILVGHLITRFVFMVAFSQDADWLTVMPSFGTFMDPAKFMAFLPVCLSFAGWICSSFFRPLDE